MLISTAAQRFLKHCERQGRRPKTLQQYRLRLKQIVEHLGTTHLDDVTRTQCLDYLHAVNTWPGGDFKSAATRRMNLTVLQLFLTWCVDEDHLDVLPLKAKDLKKPTVPKRTAIPTTEQVQQLLAGAPRRWATIYRVLRLTGARPSELVGANITDIRQFPTGPAIVLKQHKTAAETGEDRIIPLGTQVLPLIAQAIGKRQRGPIFTDRRGQRWTVDRVSENFRRRRRKLGLPEELVLYSARHDFGTQVTKQHGINAAKVLLGHRTITTTQRYAHTQANDLALEQGTVRDV